MQCSREKICTHEHTHRDRPQTKPKKEWRWDEWHQVKHSYISNYFAHTIDSTPRRNGNKYDVTLSQAMALELLLCIKACNRWCIFSISMNSWLQLPCEWRETVGRWREHNQRSLWLLHNPLQRLLILFHFTVVVCAYDALSHKMHTQRVCNANAHVFVHICNLFDCHIYWCLWYSLCVPYRT